MNLQFNANQKRLLNDDDDDDDSSKRIKLLIASSSSQKEEEIDLFSLIISQAPVVDRLIEFGINPAVLRRVTAKLFREALYLKDMEQLIAPVYADEEWANAIACSMLDRSDWLGLRREFCDEFALRGAGRYALSQPCVTLVPVHDSDLPFELDCHVNVVERADRVWTQHVDRDYGAESLDPMCGCGMCAIRSFDVHLKETNQPELREHFSIESELRHAMNFTGTPLEAKFENNADKSLGRDYRRCYGFEWIDGRYMQTFRCNATFTARENNTAPITKSDIVTLLLHIFEKFGAPLTSTVHSVATECLMLAMRFARRPMISTVLLCIGIRSLLARRIPTAGGVAFVQRLVRRSALVSMACVRRYEANDNNDDDNGDDKSDSNPANNNNNNILQCNAANNTNNNDLQIDDRKILEMREWDFNIALQHTDNHTANHLRVIGDLLCRAALYWCRERKQTL